MITESRQKRVLLIIITILFLANVATLMMFFMAKPMKKRHGEDSRTERMNGYLKKELGYNEEQLSTYKEFSKKHKLSMDSIFTDMRREKETRLKGMSLQNFSDSSIGLAATRMAENQKLLEIKMLNHLKEIRALGNEEQKRKFDTGFLNYMNRNRYRNRK